MELTTIEKHISEVIGTRIIESAFMAWSCGDIKRSEIEAQVAQDVERANDGQWQIEYRHPEGDYITDQDYSVWTGSLADDRLPIVIAAGWEVWNA